MTQSYETGNQEVFLTSNNYYVSFQFLLYLGEIFLLSPYLHHQNFRGKRLDVYKINSGYLKEGHSHVCVIITVILLLLLTFSHCNYLHIVVYTRNSSNTKLAIDYD